MDNWLKSRLTPTKIDTDRWMELSAAIESFWAENFDDDLARYISLRSIYEANEDDQKWIQAELGKYYEDEIPTLNIPLAVQRRELELSQKGSENPFQYTLARLGLNAEWVPMYAPRTDSPYGDNFVLETDRPVDEIVSLDGSHRIDGTWKVFGKVGSWKLDGTWKVNGEACLRVGYFLTSRGVIVVALGDESLSTEISIIRRRMIQTKPVWIVFDGVVYVVETVLDPDYDLDASGHLYGTSKLSGFNCPLKLDGTWGLGRTIRVDGTWAVRSTPSDCYPVKLGMIHQDKIANRLNGSWQVDGEKSLLCTPIPHNRISNCRVETSGQITGISEVTAARNGNHFVLSAELPDSIYFGGTSDTLPHDVILGDIDADSIYFGGTPTFTPLDGSKQVGMEHDGVWPYADGDITVWSYPLAFYDAVFGGSSGDLPTNILDGGNSGALPGDPTYFGGNA